jgi:hypothetical protein
MSAKPLIGSGILDCYIKLKKTSAIILPIIRIISEPSTISNKGKRTRFSLFPINSGVPQGSVLGPMLYLLFTSDLPQTPNITIGTFTYDTVILTCHDIHRASSCLQEYLLKLQSWLQTWKIKINESKSTYLTFILRNDPSTPIYVNNV